MIKKLYTFLFKTSFSEKKILLKDIFFTPDNENIIRTIRSIKKQKSNFDNAVIMDIGAFDGSTAIQFSKAFPEAKILAFEANPETFPIAQKNCASYKNISVLNFAVSDKKETLDFFVTNNGVSSSLNEINVSDKHTKDYNNELNIKTKLSVNAVPLDEYADLGKILLLKIDTQGHELKVIEGAKEILKKTEFVLVEMANHNVYKNGCQYFEVDEALRKNNFKLHNIIVSFRTNGIAVSEYDAVYINKTYN